MTTHERETVMRWAPWVIGLSLLVGGLAWWSIAHVYRRTTDWPYHPAIVCDAGQCVQTR